MSLMISYDKSPIEGLNLPAAHISRSEHDDPETIEREFESKAVGFKVTASDGSIVAAGRFHGDVRQRNWPLEFVRIAASRLEVEPVRLIYEDGKTYKFDPQFGFAVPETDV